MNISQNSPTLSLSGESDDHEGGMRSPANLHWRGVLGAASPPVEGRVQNFWKEALRFEEMDTPGEFWDDLHENMKMIAKIISQGFHDGLNSPDSFKSDTRIADSSPE